MQGADLAFVWCSKGKAMGATELVLAQAWLLTPVLGTHLRYVLLFLIRRTGVLPPLNERQTYVPTHVQLKKKKSKDQEAKCVWFEDSKQNGVPTKWRSCWTA